MDIVAIMMASPMERAGILEIMHIETFHAL